MALISKTDAMIQLALCHLGKGHAHFRVVTGGKGVFALVVGIAIVEVAGNDHLPGNLHLIPVKGGEDAGILVRLI